MPYGPCCRRWRRGRKQTSPRTLPRLAKTRLTPIYPIGAASRLSGLPIWTLRWIERHKLVAPGRTAGRQRLFSDADIERLGEIRSLLERKVNLAGIKVILGGGFASRTGSTVPRSARAARRSAS